MKNIAWRDISTVLYIKNVFVVHNMCKYYSYKIKDDFYFDLIHKVGTYIHHDII